MPSIDLWVSLSPELPRPEVVVDGERWKVIVATGAGATVADVGDVLGLGEIADQQGREGSHRDRPPHDLGAPPRAQRRAGERVEHIQLVPESRGAGRTAPLVEQAPEPAVRARA